jgi:serine/threonine protein phosphatase PrpC
MASDGLWDSVQFAEVCAVVRQPDLLGNATAATAAVMELGLKAGKRIYGNNVDNITVVVVYVS